MRCSLNFLVPVLMILAAPTVGLAQSPKFNVGTPLSQEEIQRFDFMIGPQGQDFPPGAEPPRKALAQLAQATQPACIVSKAEHLQT